MLDEQLVYVCGNAKGSLLYDALAPHYDSAHYLDATPHLVTRAGTAAAARAHVGRQWNLVNRRALAELIWFRLSRLPAAPRRSLVFWDSKFLITPRWRRFGRLSVITDVAMTREYFDNPPMPANTARQFSRDWDVLFESCDHILTLSEWAAEENRRLHAQAAHKVSKIGWGPNTPPLPESAVFAEPRRDRVITVGHDFQRKGMDLFDRVARAAGERLPGTEWLAAGEPRDFDVARLEVARALPPQTADDVSRLMRSAKVFLLLSRFEPSAHVIVEAQSNGLPVICSTRGGSAEGIVDGVTGYAVDPDDVDSVADRVVELMSHEGRRESFARAAHRNAVERHQWSNVADAVVAATRPEP